MTIVTIAYGDGVGHEVMDAALLVMREAGANLEIETVQIGERVYDMGSPNGVLPSAWQSVERSGILLKGPATRPENRQHITEAICRHFGLDIAARVTEHCNAQPEIAAISYIGESFALFEPLQDAQPELAGKNKAHPGAMMLAGAMMLDHVGQSAAAARIRAALEEALKTQKKRLRTVKFAESVVEHLALVA